MGSNRIITIARQYGSGGKTVGQMLAKDLGIDCYDREILRMASDDSGLNLQMFGNPDERRRNTFLTRAIKKVYKGEVIPPDSDDFASSDNLFQLSGKDSERTCRTGILCCHRAMCGFHSERQSECCQRIHPCTI